VRDYFLLSRLFLRAQTFHDHNGPVQSRLNILRDRRSTALARNELGPAFALPFAYEKSELLHRFEIGRAGPGYSLSGDGPPRDQREGRYHHYHNDPANHHHLLLK
jgi:hypothetical protein